MKRPLRVLFVDTAKSAPIGAGPWLHVQILRLLDRAAHRPFAACAKPVRGAAAPMFEMLQHVDGVTVIPVDFGPERLRRSLRGSWSDRAVAVADCVRAIVHVAQLGWLARRERIDVIHTDERPRDALVSVVLARVTGARSIVHMHVDYGEWMGPLLRWSLPRADRLIAISDFVAESLVAIGQSRDRISVVHNGINAADWSPSDDVASLRGELGLPQDTTIVVTVCRLLDGKGIDDVIRAIAQAADHRDRMMVLIVGQEQQTGYRSFLEDLARSLDVTVTFTGRRPDVARLMAASDIFAMPSHGEPFGLVYLEAMATELPVLAWAVGGALEVIEDGVTGYLVPLGDIDALSRRVVELVEDSELRRRLGRAGRERVWSSFTSEHMTAAVAAVYAEMVDGDAKQIRRPRE